MMNFRSIPTVTKNILIISILAFVATTLIHKVDLVRILGLHYFQAPDFKPYQFITYIFMHGSFMHLFFNMFAVFMFGAVLENAWGPKKFLAFYIFTGLGAALTQLAVYYFQIAPKLEQWQAVYGTTTDYFTQSQMIEDKKAFLNSFVVVGASGSLFGLLIAFGMMFPNAELMMLFLPIPIKAKYFVAIYGALELFSGLQNNVNDNVAHFAHLGGMLFGFILMMIWRRKSRY
jgi:membrane associated rhomboid family serine protease